MLHWRLEESVTCSHQNSSAKQKKKSKLLTEKTSQLTQRTIRCKITTLKGVSYRWCFLGGGSGGLGSLLLLSVFISTCFSLGLLFLSLVPGVESHLSFHSLSVLFFSSSSLFSSSARGSELHKLLSTVNKSY